MKIWIGISAQFFSPLCIPCQNSLKLRGPVWEIFAFLDRKIDQVLVIVFLLRYEGSTNKKA